MKRLKRWMVCLLCMVVLTGCIQGMPGVRPCCVYAMERGKEPISPEQYQKMLGKGMDVDWAKTAAGKRNYSQEAVVNFKKANISHVRIRVKDQVSEKLFETLDEQIDDCIRHDLIPVLAYQANEFKNSVSDESMEDAVSWWRDVAAHYKDYSYLLSFDLLIECSDALNKQPQKLNEYIEQATSAVRATNPQRIIMMSPRVRSDAAYLDDLEIPTQANGYLMAEWHFYASGPSKENERKLWTTGTEKEKQLIREKIDLALRWQEKTGIPTWVGAWMAGNYNDGDDYTIEEQVKFAHYMVTKLEAAGIPFAVNSDTKFYDREENRWVKRMLPLRYCIFDSYPKALRALFKESSCGKPSVKPVSKTGVTVRWGKLKRADGYQLAISTSAKFDRDKRLVTTSRTEKQVLNLRKGNVYYVKVRGYMKSEGRKVYSKYSRAVRIRL